VICRLFIDLAEQRTVIHDVPQAIADLGRNVFAAKNLAQEGLLGVEPERARATDATDFDVPRIERRRNALGIDARQGRPVGGGRTWGASRT
jgi:hypothetical protein